MASRANGKRVSSTDRAYRTIKNHILNHKLAPGARLTSRSLAKLTGVSIIPVLHALQRLDSEGLVESVPGWGSRVITLDTETIRDKYYLREAIECQVARILAEHITAEQREELIEFTRQLDVFGSVYPVDDRYWEYDHEFHLLLAKMAGSKTLLREIQKINLFRFLHRAREWTLAKNQAFPPDHHMSVVEAILSRDPDRAEKVMRNHVYHRSHSIET
jgi:DNA-binding GntR family transcriptional regulator